MIGAILSDTMLLKSPARTAKRAALLGEVPVRAELGGVHPATVVEDDCTAFIVPDHRAGGAGFYGQTWDMHDTATEHVVLLRVAPTEGPSALVFTTVGALGQIGMNELGVCLGINNLTATDGVAGVTWPQVVRSALLESLAATYNVTLSRPGSSDPSAA